MSISIWQATPADQAEVERLMPGANGPVLLMQEEGKPVGDAAGTRVVDGKYAVLELVHESDLNENMVAHFLRLWMAANGQMEAMYVPSEGAHRVFRYDGFTVAKELPPSVAEAIGVGVALVKAPKRRTLLTRKEVNSREEVRVQQRAVGANGR